ncbi:hypothetical protein [Campylobacter sp.]|uniref:hypothetical protein n=1 Tax=Campylobacter sp. TaxID=205 RepID=UPI002A590999|nr:hypothetical protein [Campylobacter sp.]MDD7091333.1 hypothetical protein [Campylobacteraceae bacterium]MDY3246564.1 hypothetical protein [Campylobacter sp.]
MYIFEKIGVNLKLDFVALLLFVIHIFLMLLPLISIIIFIKKVKRKLFYSPILILILLAEGALLFLAGLFSMPFQSYRKCPVVVSGYSLDDLRQPDDLKKPGEYNQIIRCGTVADFFYKKVEISEFAIPENNIYKAVSAILKADFYDDVLIKIFTTPPFANAKPTVLIDYKKSDDSISITIITTHKKRINE